MITIPNHANTRMSRYVALRYDPILSASGRYIPCISYSFLVVKYFILLTPNNIYFLVGLIDLGYDDNKYCILEELLV